MKLMRIALALVLSAASLDAQAPKVFTRADTLRGSDGPARSWWDVEFYDLNVAVNPGDSTIRGWNAISYRVLRPGREMQIDLQVPMRIDSIVQSGRKLAFRRDSNAFFVTGMAPAAVGARARVAVYYQGKPRAALNAPWDGGFVWKRDSLGNRFIATANQGLGASVCGPTRTTAPRSRTASASRSRCPTR